MLTEAIQHVKHSCGSEEYLEYMTGEKTFDIKLNDENFTLHTGDLITIEEVDPTGAPTGKRITRKVGVTLNTKLINNITSEEVANRGLLICSLIQPEHGLLYSLYGKYHSISMILDRHPENEIPDEKNWNVYGPISYTPAGICPEFEQIGLLDSIGFNKWPEGRFYVTLLLEIETKENSPTFKVNIKDMIVLSTAYVGENETEKQVGIVELSSDTLFAGMAIDAHTNKKMQLLSVNDAHDATAMPVPPEQLNGVDDVISENEMLEMIKNARERGEPLADRLLTPTEGED